MVKEKKSKRKKIDLLFVTAAISTALVLVLIGLIALMLFEARTLSVNLKERMTVEIVLKEGASQADITSLLNSITSSPYAKECRYISKEDALKDMSHAMGVDPTEFLEYNPFYASLSVQLNSEYAVTDSIRKMESGWTAIPVVREVNYQRDLLDTVNSNIKKVSAVFIVMALLLTMISFALISNTIKLTIYSQRFLLYSMKLVGAKWSFIRKPFILRNLCIGLMSALLASAAIYWGLKLGIRYEPALIVLLNARLLAMVFAIVLAVGLFLTWICAWSSVNKFLRMKSGELYYI